MISRSSWVWSEPGPKPWTLPGRACRALALSCCFAVLGCPAAEPELRCLEGEPPALNPDLVESGPGATGPLDVNAVVVIREGALVRVKGFSRAVPGNRRVRGRLVAGEGLASFSLGDLVAELETEALQFGSFELELLLPDEVRDEEALPTTVELWVVARPTEPAEVDIGPYPFRVRDRAGDAVDCVRHAARTTATLPNDVAYAECEEIPLALIPASGDGELDVVALGGDPESPDPVRPTAYFPPDETTGAASPWGVAYDRELARAAVTLRGASQVAWVDPCTGTIVDRRDAETSTGSRVRFEVDPPIQLREPRDIDGDGVVEDAVASMFPTGAQGVALANGRLHVTFTNILEPALDAERPMLGPGSVLASYDVGVDGLAPTGLRFLPCSNAQSVTVDRDDVWVSCTGLYEFRAGRFEAQGGALVRLAGPDLGVRDVIDLEGFGPSTPHVQDGQIVVGSTLRPQVAVLPTTARDLADAEVFDLAEPDLLQTVFEVIPLGGGLIGAAHFESDRLRILDTRAGQLDPWPFVEGIPLSSSAPGEPFRGLLALDLGPELQGVALLGLSAEVVPFDLGQVLGR